MALPLGVSIPDFQKMSILFLSYLILILNTRYWGENRISNIFSTFYEKPILSLQKIFTIHPAIYFRLFAPRIRTRCEDLKARPVTLRRPDPLKSQIDLQNLKPAYFPSGFIECS
jgi:hypothetical protein